MHASVSYRNYWNLSKASQYIDKAEKIIKNLKESGERDWLISRMHMCRAGDLYFRYSFLKFVPWTNKKAVERKIRENYCKAVEYAAESGNWTDFYQAALWSKKVGIDIAELTRDMGYIPPPDPAEGYKYLSFYIPQLIKLRHKISKSENSLKEEKKEINEHIETSKNVGYIPELWKLLLKKIRHDPWRKDVIKDIFQFLYYYKTCEYSIVFKPFIPLYYYFF